MKKLLYILAVTGIITTTSSTFISCDFNLKQDLPEIGNISLVAGKKVKDLKDVVYKKLAELSKIKEDIIKNDKNLIINTKEVKPPIYPNTHIEDNTILKDGKYTITITANENDKYFIGQRTINVKINKQDLPIFKPISLDKHKTKDEAKSLIQSRIADKTGLELNLIKDDLNLEYKFYLKDFNSDVFFPVSTEEEIELFSGLSWRINIISNASDQYFLANENKIYITINPLNLATADIEITPFKAGGKGQILFDKVYEKLEERSGWPKEQLINIDNFIKITDELNDVVNKNTDLTAQTYTITVTALNNWAFKGEKTITVTPYIKDRK